MGKQKIDAKTGIDLAAVKYEVIDSYLAKLGLPTDGGEYVRMVRLHEAMQLVPNKGSTLGNCSTCRGKSHVGLSGCPFCGDGEVDESVLRARGGVEDPETKVLDELKALLTQKASSEEGARQKDAGKAKTSAQVVAPPPAPIGEKQQELVPVPPGTGVRSRRAQRAAQVAGAAAAAEPLPGTQTAIATTEDVPTHATVQQLDESVAKIKSLWGHAAVTVYDIAVLMFDVLERRLWMQRRDEKDQPLYTTFAQWVTAEMPFSPQYAYELTNLPKFFTREDVQKIGATKLTLSLRISEEERKRLLESGDLEKMSVRQVKEQITQNPSTTAKSPEREERASLGGKDADGTPVRGPGRPRRLPGKSSSSSTKAGQKERGERLDVEERRGGDQPARKIQPEPVTLVTAVLPTQTKIEMFARPRAQGEAVRRARSLSDDPVGVIQCANGARIRVTFFVNAEGYLEGVARIESPGHTGDPDDEQE
jgi:hypothetical protein